jgi:flagellar protein FlaG
MNVGRLLNDQFENYKYKGGSGDNGSMPETVNDHPLEKEPTKAEIATAVDRLNKSIETMNERVSFSYHEGTNRVVMKVINPDTQEVIREVPARNVIKLLEHIQQYLGMFVDESR